MDEPSVKLPLQSQTLPGQKKNFPIFIIATLVLLVFAAVIGWQFFGRGVLKPPPTQEAKKEAIQLSGLEIARKTATFLDKNMEPDGSFTWRYSCSKNQATGSACVAFFEGGAAPRSGYIALAYLNLSQKTQDPSYMDKAKQVADFVLQGCKQDSSFCYWSFKPLYAIFKETGDTRYKDALLKVAADPLQEKQLVKSISNNDGHRLAILYELTGDKKYLTRLEALTTRMLSGEYTSDTSPINEALYQEGGLPIRQADLWAVWDFYLPAYQVTKNETYLKAAQDFFDKAKFSAHVDAFKTRIDQADLNVLEALLDVADASSEPKKSEYQREAYQFAQTLTIGLWDSAQSPKFTGDNGFVSLFSKDTNYKRATHNGWRVSQFVRMSDSVFQLK